MWLAAHFYSQGRISGEAFASAAVEQIRRRKPLGQIALQTQVLTMKQIMSVLGEQANRTELPFGEVAMGMGLLTADQVARLLYVQAQEVPPLEELLVEFGALTQEEVARSATFALRILYNRAQRRSCYLLSG